MRWAALTARASTREARETSPAPARKAARAASRAAPVRVAGPDTTTAWPRSYLCPSAASAGSDHRPGRFHAVFGWMVASTPAPMPMSTTSRRPAWPRPGMQQVAGLQPEEGDRAGGLDGGAEDLPAAPVDAARQVDRDHRKAGAIERADGLGGHPLDRPVEAGAEQRVDDHVGTGDEAAGQPLAGAGPRRGGEGGVAFQPVASSEQPDGHLVAGLRHQAGGDEPVAAVVAGTGHHQNPAALRQQVVDRLGHRQSGGFHQCDAGGAALDGQGVGLAHLLGGQHLDAESEISATSRGTSSISGRFTGHQALELRGPCNVN